MRYRHQTLSFVRGPGSVLLLAFAIGLAFTSAQAAIYKYTDRHGVTHYSDSYESVPAAYRDQVRDVAGDIDDMTGYIAGHDFDGWAVIEWECCLKHPEDGASEGAEFIAAHIIRVTETAFDDFAAGSVDQAGNRRALGIG